MNLPDITEVVAMGEFDQPFDGIPADSEQEFPRESPTWTSGMTSCFPT